MPDPKPSKPQGSTPRDFFYREKIFPDAKALLQYKQKSMEEIKAACLVGIDANVLLLPYQLNSVSLAEIVKVYTKLNRDKRLIFPAQAVREFFSHRAEKLAAIVEHLRNEASKLTPPLQSKIGILDGDQSFLIQGRHRIFFKRDNALTDGSDAPVGYALPMAMRYYFRRHGIRTALPGLPGSNEFMVACGAQLAKPAGTPGSFADCRVPSIT
jgi:PIN like domain